MTFPHDTPERPEADTFNDPLFVRLRDAARGSADLFAMSTQVMRPVEFCQTGGEKEPVRTQFVSGDAFERLGIGAAGGRLLGREDDLTPGASSGRRHQPCVLDSAGSAAIPRSSAAGSAWKSVSSRSSA